MLAFVEKGRKGGGEWKSEKGPTWKIRRYPTVLGYEVLNMGMTSGFILWSRGNGTLSTWNFDQK